MKRVVPLLLAVLMILSLTACADDPYPPVESTDEEKQVVMTFEIENEKYEVRYELYRALFLNLSCEYDGGSREFWSSADADEAKNEIDGRITDLAADIYATIHHAKKIGYDVYSKDADARVSELISQSVNGYTSGDSNFVGYGGDYDAYLAALKEMNLNYSVQTLLYRYSIAMEEINKYYAGETKEGSFEQASGAISATDDEVREFYFSDNSVRVLLATLDSRNYTRARAEEIRDKVASFNNEYSVSNYIVGFTATAESDAFDGVVIGKYSLDSAYYAEMIESAFSLDVGATANVLEIVSAETSSYYILYRAEKSEEHLNDNFSDIRNVYIANVIGQLLATDKEAMIATAVTTNVYNNINHSEISMK